MNNKIRMTVALPGGAKQVLNITESAYISFIGETKTKGNLLNPNNLDKRDIRNIEKNLKDIAKNMQGTLEGYVIFSE